MSLQLRRTEEAYDPTDMPNLPLSITRTQRPALMKGPAGAEPAWLSPGLSIFPHMAQCEWWPVGCRVIAECFYIPLAYKVEPHQSAAS